MAFIECHCCKDRHHIDLPSDFPMESNTVRKLDDGTLQWDVKCTKGNGINYVDIHLNVTGIAKR